MYPWVLSLSRPIRASSRVGAFAHIISQISCQLVSFLVTRNGGLQRSENKRRAADEPASPGQSRVRSSTAIKSHAFRRAHAVFVVSDLPEGDNLALARALAPSVFAPHHPRPKARLKKDGANEMNRSTFLSHARRLE